MPRSAENPIRIALLDDHPIVRHGLGKNFSRQPDFHVVGIYATGREMIGGLRTAPAEVLVVDFSLGPTEIDGINLLQLLKIKYPSSKILVASSHDDAATVKLVMRAGAKGFVAKAEPLSMLVAAIRIVAAGGIYTGEAGAVSTVQPRTSASAGSAAAVPASEAHQKDQPLSPREREVIRCCLDGMSVTEIADKFSRSRKTISSQKQSAMKKLGLRADSELLALRDQGKDLNWFLGPR
jgi:two-component system capsular synthesis response regulator RcsB